MIRRRVAIFVLFALFTGACAGGWVSDEVLEEIGELPELPAAPLPPNPAPPSPPPPGPPPPGPIPPTTSTEPTRPSDYEPAYEPTECRMVLLDNEVDRVDCGALIVPVDRALPEGPQVRVAVAIIRSTADAPLADPVLYLHGGPGGFAVPDYDQWLYPEHPILETRDLILIDQRGSGYSEPSLNCPEVEGFGNPLNGLRDCFQRLADEGVDVNRFTTEDIALDIADLRIALGYESWNLYGVSYGTRAALAAMRAEPAGLRSVVLDSPYPPEVEAYAEQAPNGRRAMDSVLQACTADPRCGEAFGDLRPTLDRLLTDLAESSETVTVDALFGGEPIEITVDDSVLANGIFATLYDTFSARAVPLAIHRAAEGDLDSAAELLSLAGGFHKPRAQDEDEYLSLIDAEGAHWSPECAEEVAGSSLDEAVDAAQADNPIDQALLGDVEYVFSACRVWAVDAAPAATQDPIRSDVRTLIVAGQFDPITPPGWGERTADDLTSAQLVIVPFAGHGSTYERCPESLMMAFLDDPDQGVDTACLGELEARFRLP
ncbi:MAG: alpha/beta hydrolase [Acidimicrobiales bacterium]|nr:alpha/beta hydrolase [Acidimicrobiales bacterium]